MKSPNSEETIDISVFLQQLSFSSSLFLLYTWKLEIYGAWSCTSSSVIAAAALLCGRSDILVISGRRWNERRWDWIRGRGRSRLRVDTGRTWVGCRFWVAQLKVNEKQSWVKKCLGRGFKPPNLNWQSCTEIKEYKRSLLLYIAVSLELCYLMNGKQSYSKYSNYWYTYKGIDCSKICLRRFLSLFPFRGILRPIKHAHFCNDLRENIPDQSANDGTMATKNTENRTFCTFRISSLQYRPNSLTRAKTVALVDMRSLPGDIRKLSSPTLPWES